MSTPALLPLLAPHLHFAGVDPRLLDEARLRWTVDARCRELGLTDAIAYVSSLASSPAELEAIMESVVVGETRFFRDASVFAGIRSWASAQPAITPLRILSAPCSTGQEAYSLAATLIAAGVTPERFTIDALDISSEALRVARQGVYAETALRSLDERDRQTLAHFHEDRWIIRDELKSRVRFDQRNLATPGALQGEQYHLILCRNLFIYLHTEARAILAATLSDALLPGGRLVIGTADHVPELNALFAPLQPAAAFALIPQRDATKPAPRPTHKPVSGTPVSGTPVSGTPVSGTPVSGTPVSGTPVSGLRLKTPSPPAEDTPLHTASAEDLLHRALESQRVGNVRLAERRCRQALYVDPAYLPAMELLDTLWHSTASVRMRAALAARIHRLRGLEAAQ